MRAHLSIQACLSIAVGLLGGCSTPSEPDLVPLVVAPAAGRIAVGGALQLSVSAPGASQGPSSSTGLVWSSSDPSVAEVNDHGSVLGRAGGTAEISAQWNGLRAVSYITVVATSVVLKPPKDPKSCPALISSAKKRDANAETAIPVCKER